MDGRDHRPRDARPARLRRHIETARRGKPGWLGASFFLGEVLDIKAWYRRLSLYVAPSRVEGFGLTPLEAMASGVAVVASDAGAYAEMIEDGRTGAVVAAGDGSALEAAIRAYLEDPERAQSHGHAALEHVRRNFPLQREADAILGVYEQVWAQAT